MSRDISTLDMALADNYEYGKGLLFVFTFFDFGPFPAGSLPFRDVRMVIDFRVT